MSAQFRVVTEDFTNRDQSWIFAGLYRNNSGPFRVIVRDNAYANQSQAAVFTWGLGGWLLFTEIPVEDWHETAPSYTKPHLDDEDKRLFQDIARELLSRLAHGLWGTTDGVVLSHVEEHRPYLASV